MPTSELYFDLISELVSSYVCLRFRELPAIDIVWPIPISILFRVDLDHMSSGSSERRVSIIVVEKALQIVEEKRTKVRISRLVVGIEQT